MAYTLIAHRLEENNAHRPDMIEKMIKQKIAIDSINLTKMSNEMEFILLIWQTNIEK